MISVVIPTLNAQARLGPCLASLAPGLSAGILREVVFADGGSTDDTPAIAEAVGARLAAGAPGAALAVARGPWVLLIEPDAVLAETWPAAVRMHIAAHPDAAGWFDLNLAGAGPGPWLAATAANLRASLLRAPGPAHGLLLPAAHWRGAPPEAGHAALVARARRGGLRGIGAGILVPWRGRREPWQRRRTPHV